MPIALLLGLASYFASIFGTEWAGLTNDIAVVWIANGMLLGVLLTIPMARWGLHLLVFYLAQIAANLALGESLGIAVIYPFGDFLGTLIGAVLIWRFSGIPAHLLSVKSLVQFIAFAAVIGQAVGGFFGAAVAYHAFESAFLPTWLTWSISGSIGIIMVTPLLLVLPGIAALRNLRPQRIAEILMLAALAVIVAYYASRIPDIPLLYIVSPVLLYSALRYHAPGAALVNFLAAAVIVFTNLDHIVGTVSDDRVSALAKVLFSQLYLIVLFLPVLFTAALMEQVKKSNLALAAAQKKYRDFADAASDWQWETDASLRFTGFSNRFEAATGYRISDFLGKSRLAFAAQPDSAAFRAHMQNMQAHRPFRDFRYWFADPSGTPRLAEINGKPLFGENGEFTGYRGTASDITDKFEAEERFRAIFANANIAILIVGVDGRIQLANQKLSDLLGFTLDELTAMNVADITHPDDVQNTSDNLSELQVSDTKTLDVEKRYISKTGETIWGSLSVAAISGPSDSEPMYFVSAIHDITIQKRQAWSLEVNKARYKRAARLARTGHWAWDLEADKCSYASPEMARLFGASPETFCENLSSTKAFLDWVHPDDRDRFNDAFRQLISLGTGIDLEARVVLGDRSVRHFHFLTEPVQNASGKVTHSNGVLIDVSVERETADALRQSQKMEAIGQLTGGVAHDFNNLLAIILGNLELLREINSTPETEEFIVPAIEATIHGSDLTKNMLSFARKARLEPQILDLNQIVRKTKNWSARALPATIEVETSLLAGLWQVEADPASTENAILNLILNARDAMPNGGRLTIETANVRIDSEYLYSRREDLDPGRYVMVAVSDTGMGIDANNLANVFEPFFTTKGPGEGSGLGLSMVQGFMKQSGGTVRVYSEIGEGTTFKMYFKAAERVPEMHAPLASTEPTDISSGARILLAEDEPDLMKVITTILESNGYVVFPASSGIEALEVFETCGDIDLLLTDIVMPGAVQGPELAKLLRAKQPDLAAIFMSGYANEATVHGNGLRDEDIRLMKPINKMTLIAAIEKAFR